jgi:hypothetical protein
MASICEFHCLCGNRAEKKNLELKSRKCGTQDTIPLSGRGRWPRPEALKTLASEDEPMGYYALLYDMVGDYIARRATFRQEHLKLAAESHARGELLMGGAFADPADRGLLIFRAENRGVAESFARKDPYVLNGLILRWEVRQWTVVIGNTDPPISVPPAP